MHTNTNVGLLPGQSVDRAMPLAAMNGQHRNGLKKADRRGSKQTLARFIGTVDWDDEDF